MTATTLELIDEEIEQIEVSCKESDDGGLTDETTEALPERFRTWEERTESFQAIASELNNVAQEHEELRPRTSELFRRARTAEYLLNAMGRYTDVPVEDRLKALRVIGSDKDLMPLARIRERLAELAVQHADDKVRRTAWLALCHYYARHHARGYRDTRNEKFERENMKQFRKALIRDRGAVGPRASVLETAQVRPGYEERCRTLTEALARSEGDRKEIALTLSEIGGDETAIFLTDALRAEIEEQNQDEEYEVYLASALSNLGGPQAVEGLLWALENGSDRVRLSALSGLESLTTAGSVALIEYPEPATIENEEMRDVYVEIAQTVENVVRDPVTDSYVRHKAAELLELVHLSLADAQVPA